jgi:hypothetical protein
MVRHRGAKSAHDDDDHDDDHDEWWRSRSRMTDDILQ